MSARRSRSSAAEAEASSSASASSWKDDELRAFFQAYEDLEEKAVGVLQRRYHRSLEECESLLDQALPYLGTKDASEDGFVSFMRGESMVRRTPQKKGARPTPKKESGSSTAESLVPAAVAAPAPILEEAHEGRPKRASALNMKRKLSEWGAEAEEPAILNRRPKRQARQLFVEPAPAPQAPSTRSSRHVPPPRRSAAVTLDEDPEYKPSPAKRRVASTKYDAEEYEVAALPLRQRASSRRRGAQGEEPDAMEPRIASGCRHRSKNPAVTRLWHALVEHSEYKERSGGKRFAWFEWFYGSVDRSFFCSPDFADEMAEVGVDKRFTHLARIEWSQVRAAMGHPRRLSPAFLRLERGKLVKHRDMIRAVQQGRADPKELPDCNFDIPNQLSPGLKCIALHPKSYLPHVGHVVSVVNNKRGQPCYVVRFARSALGQVTVSDVDVAPYGTIELRHRRRPRAPGTMPGPGPGRGFALARSAAASIAASRAPRPGVAAHMAEDGQDDGGNDFLPDSRDVARVVRLLRAKSELVAQLKEMNREAERLVGYGGERGAAPGPATPAATPAPGPSAALGLDGTPSPSAPGPDPAPAARPPLVSEAFRQSYALVVLRLEQLNGELEPALERIRLDVGAWNLYDEDGPAPQAGADAAGASAAGPRSSAELLLSAREEAVAVVERATARLLGEGPAPASSSSSSAPPAAPSSPPPAPFTPAPSRPPPTPGSAQAPGPDSPAPPPPPPPRPPLRAALASLPPQAADLATSCVALLCVLRHAAASGGPGRLPPEEACLAVDKAMTALTPTFTANLPAYEEISEAVTGIREKMSLGVAK